MGTIFTMQMLEQLVKPTERTRCIWRRYIKVTEKIAIRILFSNPRQERVEESRLMSICRKTDGAGDAPSTCFFLQVQQPTGFVLFNSKCKLCQGKLCQVRCRHVPF